MEQGRNGSNCKTLFGIEKIPSGNHIRDLLAPVPPERLGHASVRCRSRRDSRGGMKDFERLGGRVLVALDGT